jgi:hypothetical protein
MIEKERDSFTWRDAAMSPNPAIFARVLGKVLSTDSLLCEETTATALLKSVAAYMDKSKRERIGTFEGLLAAETIPQDRAEVFSKGEELVRNSNEDPIIIDEDNQEQIAAERPKKKTNSKAPQNRNQPHRGAKNKIQNPENDPSSKTVKGGSKTKVAEPSKNPKVVGPSKKSKTSKGKSKTPVTSEDDVGKNDTTSDLMIIPKPKRKYTRAKSNDEEDLHSHTSRLPPPSTGDTSLGGNAAVAPMVQNVNYSAEDHYKFVKDQLRHQFSIDRLRSKQQNSLKRLRNKKAKKDLIESQAMKTMAHKHLRSENALDIQAQQLAHQSSLLMTMNPWSMMQQQWQQSMFNPNPAVPITPPVTSAVSSIKKSQKSSKASSRQQHSSQSGQKISKKSSSSSTTSTSKVSIRELTSAPGMNMMPPNPGMMSIMPHHSGMMSMMPQHSAGMANMLQPYPAFFNMMPPTFGGSVQQSPMMALWNQRDGDGICNEDEEDDEEEDEEDNEDVDEDDEDVDEDDEDVDEDEDGNYDEEDDDEDEAN